MNRPIVMSLLGLAIAAANLQLVPTTVAARSAIATLPATQSWTPLLLHELLDDATELSNVDVARFGNGHTMAANDSRPG